MSDRSDRTAASQSPSREDRSMLGDSADTDEDRILFEALTGAADALNAFDKFDWVTLKEVLRRHCRTPVGDADWDNLVQDLQISFGGRLGLPSDIVSFLMIIGGEHESLAADYLDSAHLDRLRLSVAADEQVGRLRSAFGVRLKHILELPVRGSRDWVRVHVEDFEILSGDKSPPGSIRSRVGIELRDGSILRFETPPTSYVNLCSRMLQRLAEWDARIASEASQGSWEQLKGALQGLLEQMEDRPSESL